MNNSLGTHKQGKYFGIIADYRNTASSKAFMMKIVEPYLPKVDTNTTGKDESSKDDTTKDNVLTKTVFFRLIYL